MSILYCYSRSYNIISYMHDHNIIIKEELSSITLPTTPIIVKQASLECVSVVTSTLEYTMDLPYSKVVITSFRCMKARRQLNWHLICIENSKHYNSTELCKLLATGLVAWSSSFGEYHHMHGNASLNLLQF